MSTLTSLFRSWYKSTILSNQHDNQNPRRQENKRFFKLSNLRKPNPRNAVFFKQALILGSLFLMAPSTALAECKNTSGKVVEVTTGSQCAALANNFGDVAPYGTPDGILDISDAVVALRISLNLITSIDQTYQAKVDLAPICIKGSGGCTKTGDGNIEISDAVVILRLALGLIDPTTVVWPSAGGLKFDVTGATTLQAMNSLIIKTIQPSQEKPSILHYRVVDQDSHQARAGEPGTNLIAVNADGSSHMAIQSDLPTKVMYTVTSPDQTYVYMALDPTVSQSLIAQQNCAFYRVKVSDNASNCVMEGIYLQEFNDEYKRKFGTLKPIQFDNNGVLYFAGSAYTKSASTIDKGTWHPIIYQYNSTTGTITQITNDALQIKLFMVLSTGELIYQGANVINGVEKLWLYQAGSSIALNSTPPDYLMRDTFHSLFWGGQDNQQQPGIWFARPITQGGVQKAILYTFRQSGDAVNPTQLAIGDDGGLYGVFSSASGVEVDQMLPYQNTVKATFGTPSGLMRTPAIQVSQGYLYYLDTIDPGDTFGPRDVIQKVDLLSGKKETLLSDRRFDIYAWRMSSKVLFFSGLNLANTKLVSGQIDTLKVRQGKTITEYLLTQEVASALSAAGKVQDIEILTPQEPLKDPGGYAVGIARANEKNPYSVSIEFSKYMDKNSVEQNLSFSAANGSVSILPVWFYQKLHLIPDLDGLSDGNRTTPLKNGVAYTLAVNSTAKDAYNWDLVDENNQAGINKTFTLQPGSSSGTAPTNTPPTIATIADQSTNKNQATGTILFTVGDKESDPSSLTVTAVSYNTTLIPNNQIALGGSGKDRSMLITPATGQTGTATITVTVSDGTLNATSSFGMAVIVPPSPPTISAIGNQTLQVGNTLPAIVFKVSDTETPAASLKVTGTSSNPTLVTATGIMFGGSDSDRTVIITPVAGQTGSAEITITVNDGNDTANTKFTVTVSANQPPTISTIPNQTVNVNTATSAINFTVGDKETAAASLTVSGSSSNTTLIPNANIAFGGSSANRTVTVTPASGQSGSATITVTVNDGKDKASTTFTVTVSKPNSVPVANAGSNQDAVVAGNTVTLDGSASSDADGDTLTYSWTQTSGIPVTLSSNTAAKPTFTAPSTTGALVFSLVVNDGKANSSVYSTTVTVKSNIYSNSLGMSFKLIPAGTFMMGGYTLRGNATPTHRVTISKAFYMQTTEVTQGQWKAVMGSNPSKFSSCGDTCPVEQVSWNDIQTFLTKLNAKGEGTYSLPTEAQWEYAARAGTTTAYSFGGSDSKLGDYTWNVLNASSKTHPVATKLSNPWGLYDMHGNVWEWVQDGYNSYSSAAATDPIGSGWHRVIRGGDWSDGHESMRSADRYDYGEDDRNAGQGFRLSIVP